ncbi:MAG: HAD-IIB family hydrolase [Verrucomicrobiota bacterium]
MTTVPARNQRWILATDIDNTLTGDAEALANLAADLQQARESESLVLILTTGRRIEQVISGIADEGLPTPDAVICQVGTEIFLPPFDCTHPPLPAWDKHLRRSFSRKQALALLEGIPGLEMQPPECNTALKVSCYLDNTPNPERAAAEIRRRAERHAPNAQVIWSSGRDLDIIPAAAGKGKAVRFLQTHLDLTDSPVVVAGDSGNDSAMFSTFGRGIVVSNAQPELKEAARALAKTDIVFVTQPYAAGVREGLRRFGVLT